ncbi:PAS domain-containing sensor histidine kinase [Nostoc sp. XA010]|uniref:PAS domain-containing sensor histidine kinase n=1 Tax=Nostoc sp. XA010 TaxID=2780407 RepID=UPI001E41131F|nr:ATP-binding protein [Nostoc sp. XA010]MCC5660819.1 PAS domain-containing sensor histidine kinase [Nostoc sp. XA010]
MVSNNGILEQQNFQVTLPHIWEHDISDVYDELRLRQQSFLALQTKNTALESKVQELLAELNAAKEELCREKASYQQTQIELEKSLSLLQATFDSTADSIIAISCKGDILTCNQKFFQMWQIPDSMMMSQNPNQYVTFYKDQLKNPEIFCGRIQELDGQLDFRDYDILEFKDGRFFEQYCQTLRLGEQTIGTVWSFREITKQRQTEEEIRFALKQEKQLAEDRAHFVSMASHEFRAPLNIISFATSLLKRYYHCWAEEKKLQYLQQLETAVEQLSHLMDEFLTLDRAEVGKLKFEPEALNLAQFCRDIVTELNFKSHDHSINFVSQGDCQSVFLDKKLLQPILTNLLSNAIKYSPVGTTVNVIISCQEKIIFQIKDRGIGISPTDQQRLFEPFYRGENTGDIPGNGLGLALVKKLVNLHHGQITVTSEVGVGTTFTITLPFCQPVKAQAYHYIRSALRESQNVIVIEFASRVKKFN